MSTVFIGRPQVHGLPRLIFLVWISSALTMFRSGTTSQMGGSNCTSVENPGRLWENLRCSTHSFCESGCGGTRGAGGGIHSALDLSILLQDVDQTGFRLFTTVWSIVGAMLEWAGGGGKGGGCPVGDAEILGRQGFFLFGNRFYPFFRSPCFFPPTVSFMDLLCIISKYDTRLRVLCGMEGLRRSNCTTELRMGAKDERVFSRQ